MRKIARPETPTFAPGDRVRLRPEIAGYIGGRNPHRGLLVVVRVEPDPRWVVVRRVSPKGRDALRAAGGDPSATLWPASQLRKVRR